MPHAAVQRLQQVLATIRLLAQGNLGIRKQPDDDPNRLILSDDAVLSGGRQGQQQGVSVDTTSSSVGRAGEDG